MHVYQEHGPQGDGLDEQDDGAGGLRGRDGEDAVDDAPQLTAESAVLAAPQCATSASSGGERWSWPALHGHGGGPEPHSPRSEAAAPPAGRAKVAESEALLCNTQVRHEAGGHGEVGKPRADGGGLLKEADGRLPGLQVNAGQGGRRRAACRSDGHPCRDGNGTRH